MLPHGSVGRVHSKEWCFMFTHNFLAFVVVVVVVVVQQKNVFLSFSFLFLLKYQIFAT